LAILTVYKPLLISPVSKTIKAGDSVVFSASGGVPSPNYDFYVNSVLEGSSSGGWTYTFTLADTFVVEADDSLGNRAVATVTALVAGGDLGIAVDQNFVLQDGSINVKVINPTGSHTLSTDPPGVGSFNDSNAMSTTYNAPSSETVVTIYVHDSVGRTAEATVHVLSSVPDSLSLSPSSAVIALGDTRTLTASGGVTPYTFWVEGDGSWTPNATNPKEVLYHAPYYETKALVWIEDTIGNKATATIKVSSLPLLLVAW
jgi:hypothetical protein